MSAEEQEGAVGNTCTPFPATLARLCSVDGARNASMHDWLISANHTLSTVLQSPISSQHQEHHLNEGSSSQSQNLRQTWHRLGKHLHPSPHARGGESGEGITFINLSSALLLPWGQVRAVGVPVIIANYAGITGHRKWDVEFLKRKHQRPRLES